MSLDVQHERSRVVARDIPDISPREDPRREASDEIRVVCL